MAAPPPTGEGRWEKAMSDKSHVYGSGESDRSVVPSKSRNKGGLPLADGMEGRERTKENTVESNPCRTQRRISGPSRLDGVRQVDRCGHRISDPNPLESFVAIIRGRSRVR